MVVRPFIIRFSSRKIASSVCVSTADKLSSKIIIRGFFTSARAMPVRCFGPPDSVTPRSPTIVS